jgi:hypothetical protein
MSFEFNDPIAVKTIATGESLIFGGFTMPANYNGPVEIKHIRAMLVVENTPITNQGLVAEIHRNSDCTSLISQSSVFQISQISNISSRWIGLIRFDFPPTAIQFNLMYWIKVIPQNYTRIDKDSFMGLVFDWPIAHTTNEDEIPWKRPLLFENYVLIGKQ